MCELMCEAGWQARLELEFSGLQGSTRLCKNKHIGPLMVQKPFYDRGECHTYILHPPGGIANKDELTLDISLNDQAKVLFTTTGASKFYRAIEGSRSSVNQHIKVNRSSIEWLPQMNLFFNGAQSNIRNHFHVEDGQLLMWEINAIHKHPTTMPSSPESLTNTLSVDSRTQVWLNGEVVFIDRQLIDEDSLSQVNQFNNANAFGHFMVSHPPANFLQRIRQYAEADTLTHSAVTRIDDLLVLRSLAAKATDIEALFVQCWQEIRQDYLQFPAVAPRIWAT